MKPATYACVSPDRTSTGDVNSNLTSVPPKEKIKIETLRTKSFAMKMFLTT